VPPTHLLPVRGLRALSRRQGPHERNHSKARWAAFYVERDCEFRVLFSTRAAQIEFFYSTLFWTPFSGERPAYHAASPIDGAVYQLVAVCELTSYAYVESVKTHTIEDWIKFLRYVVLHARLLGHAPVRVRFDRASELRADVFRRCAEKELNLIVELTPREHHQGVGRAERQHDTVTRLAEAMLQRARMGTSWMLPARVYANYIENRTVYTPTAITKYQRYHSRVPSFEGNIPYIFGTSVVVVEAVRGPKGSLDALRGSIGRVVGIYGSSKLVFRDLRLSTVAQDRVQPLNELALVRSSLPAAVASVDSATQTACEAAPMPAVAAVPLARLPVATVDLPLGARVEVRWTSKGKHPVPTAWYKGTVVSLRDYAGGRRRHFVAYNGFPDEHFLHDFASTDFEWRRLDSASAPLGALAPSPAPGPVTRARRAAAAHALVEAVLETVTALRHAEAFNAAVFQALGDASDAYSCASAEDLDLARLHLAADARGLAALGQPICPLSGVTSSLQCNHAQWLPSVAGSLQCNKASQGVVDKASQGVVDILTPTGIMQLTVPATARQVMESDQRDHWLAADGKALQALLAFSSNHLVPVSVPRAAGLPIVPGVTMHRLKVDAAMQDLELRNAYMSRHCVAGNRQGHLLVAAGFVNPGKVETSSSVVDNITVKMTIADTAMRDHDLAKADVPNAYLHGERQDRPITCMALPATLGHLCADDGSELCIELGVPCWGEEAAGYEWAQARDKNLRRRRRAHRPVLACRPGPRSARRRVVGRQ